jgi:hypothetical protein
MIGGGAEAAGMLQLTPSTPPMLRPGAQKLLLNGVGAEIVENEATKAIARN